MHLHKWHIHATKSDIFLHILQYIWHNNCSRIFLENIEEFISYEGCWNVKILVIFFILFSIVASNELCHITTPFPNKCPNWWDWLLCMQYYEKIWYGTYPLMLIALFQIWPLCLGFGWWWLVPSCFAPTTLYIDCDLSKFYPVNCSSLLTTWLLKYVSKANWDGCLYQSVMLCKEVV